MNVYLLKALTVTDAKTTVSVLIIHNYSHESMHSYLLYKCLPGYANLNPVTHVFPKWMLFYCLVVQARCMCDASPLKHNMEQIMYVQYFLHTLKDLAVNTVVSYIVVHLQ